VDGVCASAGEECRATEWDIDFVMTGSQKCIGVPAGLSISMIRPRALKVRARIFEFNRNNSAKKYFKFLFKGNRNSQAKKELLRRLEQMDSNNEKLCRKKAMVHIFFIEFFVF